MTHTLTAHASTVISRPAADVWTALVTPASIKEYMFGTNASSDWREGSPITWKGEWQGRSYEDKGIITRVEPNRVLQYTHFSPLAGLPDKPENYHTVTITLAPEGNGTRVSLSQDNNANENEREHSQKNWEMMLGSLKKFLER
jgi:uncharacterized protein YndB with AHSA1/START domain